MHKHLFAICFLLFCISSYAQDEIPTSVTESTTENRIRKISDPAIFMDFGTGFNNPSGILGFDFNIPVGRFVTFDAGMGTSTWGNKIYAGAKYYLKPKYKGWAFSGGITFNSGEDNRKMNLETIYGKEKVTINFKAQTNAFIAAYHYWRLGKRNNRFYVMGGNSIQLHHCHYTEKYGDALTDNSNNRVKRLCPGGLMLGSGFSFCLRNK